MSYYIMRFISFICCLLPAGICELLGKLLGNIVWLVVPPRRKKLAQENIRRCLGVSEGEARRIAKASTVRFGPMLFEVLRFPVIVRNMDKYVTIEGGENLQRGLARGKGTVIATAHSGNWELMGAALAGGGYPLVAVAMKQKQASMDKFINECRTLAGMHVTYKTGVREMIEMLSEGWHIGLLMDQDTSPHDGVLLDFFGQPTNCVTGPASLARFKNAPICPGYITRRPDGTHRIIIHPPLHLERTKDKQGDIKRTMQQINAYLENHIRAYPEEWFWLHDRWKSVREEHGEFTNDRPG